MELNFKIKPKYYTEYTKNRLIERITRGHSFCVGGNKQCHYSCWTKRKNYVGEIEYLRVFNLIKHNRRTKQSPKGEQKAYWEAFVYDIPFEIIKIMKMNITQNRRNFIKSYNR